jgi:hypothetical protein
MRSCESAHRLMARAAEGEGPSPELDAHLLTCAGCRADLAAQQAVVRTLRSREPVRVPPGFAARVSARLDDESRTGVLELADWRNWTFGLAPVAAAFVLAAYLGVGVNSSPGTDAEATAVAAGEPSFDTWTAASGSPASVFLQPAASSDLLIETILTGAVPTSEPSGETNVR